MWVRVALFAAQLAWGHRHQLARAAKTDAKMRLTAFLVGLGVSVAVVLFPVVVIAGSAVIVSSSIADAAARLAACVPTGPGLSHPDAGGADLRSVEDLTDRQLEHAATVIRVGREMSVPDRGVVVALATVAQESTFLNYANDGKIDEPGELAPEQLDVWRSLSLPHDAVGTDHGSVGIFQQQYPWWGTLEELMTPAVSARLFYEALSEVPNWESMPVTVAAQTVQKSRYGSAYARWETLAVDLLVTLDDDARRAGATTPQAAVAAGCLPVREGLTGVPPGAAGAWQSPLPPGTYRITSPFGPRTHPVTGERNKPHNGVDLAARPGTPVRAASGGKVSVAGWVGTYGNVVYVDHPDGTETRYAHLSTIAVGAGSIVAAGDIVGGVGSTGRSTGPHLHFEIREAGTAVDPVAWLWQRHGIRL